MSPRSSQHGFGLVEVMVALFIFLVAIVGGAALLMAAKQTEFESYQRALATQIASAIVERVRINTTNTTAYHTGKDTPLTGGNRTAGTVCRGGTVCTTAQMVDFDLWEMDQLLRGTQVTLSDGAPAGGLVNPNACVRFTAADASTPDTGTLRVIVTWEDRRATADATSEEPEQCGNGAANSNPYRRQVVLDTFVMDSTE